MSKTVILIFAMLCFTSCSDSKNSKIETNRNVKQKQETKETEKKAVETTSASNNQATSPKWVAEQVFNAARTGEVAILGTLCDPVGELDFNMQRLCRVPEFDKVKKEDFMNYFKTGSVLGDPLIVGNLASVKVKFGQDGTREETFEMIKRDGKWYLSRFAPKKSN